jgi:hypothetical protein
MPFTAGEIILLTTSVLVAVPLSVVLHELAHAFTALALSREAVIVSFGRNDNKKRSFTWQLGRLRIEGRKNFLRWWHGVCQVEQDNFSAVRMMCVTLAGPLMNLVLGIFLFRLCLVAWLEQGDTFRTLLLFPSLLSSFFYFISSALPHGFHSGEGSAGSDGMLFIQLLYWNRFPREVMIANKRMEQKRYAEAAIIYQQMLARPDARPELLKLAIHAMVAAGDSTSALILLEKQDPLLADKDWIIRQKQTLTQQLNYTSPSILHT